MDPNEVVVLTSFEAVEERDTQKLFATFRDDVEFHEAPSLPYGGVSRGKTAMWARLQTAPETTWLGTWGPLQPTGAERRMDPRVVATGGREVTIAYTQRGLNVNGERFDSPVVGLYTVVAGKLARAQMFHYDTAAILAFLKRSSERLFEYRRHGPPDVAA